MRAMWGQRGISVLKTQKERCLLHVHPTQNGTAVTPSCFTGTYNTKRKCSDVIVFYRYIQRNTKWQWRQHLSKVHPIQNEKALTSPAVTGSYNTKMKTVTSPSYNGMYNTKRNGSNVTSCLNTTQNKNAVTSQNEKQCGHRLLKVHTTQNQSL